jgi:hypothetical protein
MSHPSFSCILHRPRRIRSLEAHVADIRQSQTAIQNTLVEIVNHLRAGTTSMIRSPSAFSPAYLHTTPNVHADSPASMSTPVSARPPLDAGHTMISTPQPGNSSVRPFASSDCSKLLINSVWQIYPNSSVAAMRANGDAQVPQGTATYQSIGPQYHMSSSVPPVLPPISTMEPTGSRADNISSVRHQYANNGHSRHQPFNKQPSVLGGSGPGKRPFPISAPTSADSSDEEEDGGELPASGLVAPWEVLRGLADVAIERAAKASRYNFRYHSFHSVRCL